MGEKSYSIWEAYFRSSVSSYLYFHIFVMILKYLISVPSRLFTKQPRYDVLISVCFSVPTLMKLECVTATHK